MILPARSSAWTQPNAWKSVRRNNEAGIGVRQTLTFAAQPVQ